MAERGGFGPNEFVMYYYRKPDNEKFWGFQEYWRELYKLELHERRRKELEQAERSRSSYE
jgi:uncharacterized Fe-S cluster-containing radical SAM superfamily enzyme